MKGVLMRSLWKGALSFGLVHIPVRMYSASAERELSFKLLHKKDLSEIRYSRLCKADGKEIPWEDLVKGYEIEDGAYVVLTQQDFESANIQKTRTIEILDFTYENQIDTIYYDTPYYLEPDKGAKNAYSLLYQALKQTKKIAVGRFVFHNHEHIGVIRVYKNILILHQLRYHNQIKNIKELNISHSPVSKTELNLARKLIEELTESFKPEKYSDTYIDEVKAIIKKKAKGQKVSIQKSSTDKSPKIHDILSLLKKSLKKDAKKTKRRKSA
jgi:DNA end-binding protein Ku